MSPETGRGRVEGVDGYLRFEEHPSQTGKTKVVLVYSVRSGDVLAIIAWFGRWRCYTFQPRPRTTWNTACLKEIYSKIDSMMEQRKVKTSFDPDRDGDQHP